MTGAGHVFVYRGDIRTLACDAWFLSTDIRMRARRMREGDDEIGAAVDELHRTGPPPEWSDGGNRVLPLPLADPRRATPVLATLPLEGTDDPAYHHETLRQFVECARTLPRPQGFTRARRLLAVPLAGTGRGGGHQHRGRHLRGWLTGLAEEAERHGVDIAFVTNNGITTAAAHAERRKLALTRDALAFGELSPDLHAQARRLAGLAREGKLVVFSGAGLGVAAGLPNWTGLLDQLAVKAGFDEEQRAALAAVDVLDQAALLSARLSEKAMTDDIAQMLDIPHHGISHGLLANLPVTEIATLNYDQLHELAAKGAGQKLAVLPYEPVTEPWLLKMHGCIAEGRRGDIVLTRSHYLRFTEHRASLTGLVQALLVTRHMLFVGFALRDDHFHAVVHDVRRALGEHPDEEKLGTALLLASDALQQELWARDLTCVPTGDGTNTLETARRLEIFLDLVLHLASSSDEYLFETTYDEVLTDEERALRDALSNLAAQQERFAGAPAWQRVRRLLGELGALEADGSIQSRNRTTEGDRR